jgi:hypothetical protein
MVTTGGGNGQQKQRQQCLYSLETIQTGEKDQRNKECGNEKVEFWLRQAKQGRECDTTNEGQGRGNEEMFGNI